MGTVPTNALERAMRKQYLQWLAGLDRHEDDLQDYINKYQKESTALISKLGGQVASLGALADFPVPKTLTLSPHVGTVYNDMQQAAISAGITAGLNAKDVARQMLNAGLDKSYRRLERLARTETVSAYWKNSWDSIADLPLIVMIWGSEHSKRTCDYCLSRDGLVIEDGNIRDHPNGRCTPIPTLRSAVQYKGTLQPDGSVFMDPRWADQKVKGAKAMESAGPTTEAQRDPLSGKSNPAAPSVAQPAQAVKGGSAASVAYEQKFVDSLVKQLEAGDFSRAQLRAMAVGANPLAQANVSQALATYAERTAVRPVSRVAAKLPTLSSDVIDALQPPVRFTESVRTKALKALGSTPNGRLISEQLAKFQSGPRGAIAKLRNDVQAYISGSRDLAKGRQNTIEAVLGGIRSSKVPAGVQLQRGMMIPGDFASAMARYEAGDSLDLSISSFSSSRVKAEEFSRITEGTKVSGQTTQMLVSIKGDAHALPIENLAPGSAGSVYRKEREWIASGRYTVSDVFSDVDSYGNPLVHVEIQEVAPW